MKKKMFTMRMDVTDYAIIKDVSDIMNRSMSRFMIDASLKVAREIEKEEHFRDLRALKRKYGRSREQYSTLDSDFSSLSDDSEMG